ncbi:MAG: VWA domain-containing protein [Zoogloeaceae bacterium]|nr:VWA domain-containing protein [Zoogloeaceae bacterium]
MLPLLRQCGYILCLLGMMLLFPGRSLVAAEVPLKVEGAYSAAAVAPGTAVTLNILVTIEAPPAPQKQTRPPVSVSLVIDRSGSMEEAKKLNYAIRAGKTLVQALNENDRFGLVIYDDEVEELHPLSPLRDKNKILRLLDGISSGSRTFLSGGLEAGIKQLRGDKSEQVRRVILLSDGLANVGVTGSEQVAAIGAKARKESISVSAIGLGLDYDETLMQLLAQRGGGQYYYVKDSEDLPAVFRQELALATDTCTRDLSALFAPTGAVRDVKIFGYNIQKDSGASQRIEMSDFYSGEKRQVMLRLTVTPEAGTKKQNLGVLDLAYTNIADGKPQKVSLPLALAVEADEQARKAANAKAEKSIRIVEEEGLLLEAEESHVAAMTALEQGKKEEARKILNASKAQLAPRASENKAIANKLAAMDEDERNLDAASRNKSAQQSMSKAAKNSQYQSSQGKQQGIMLQKGDKDFMVEKLQKTLAAKGFYKGKITGEYNAELEEAVKAFQKANSIDADGIAGPVTQRALGM